MKIRWMVWLIAAIIATLLIGCSGADIPVVPTNPGLAANIEDTPSAPRYLWGYWTCYLDPDSREMVAVPERTNALHVNVLVFLQKGTPNLIIKNLAFDVEQVDVDVEIRHPFPGMNQYTGFDVHGIFITGGSISGYSDGAIIHPDRSETYLMNADGWTRWWNPSEFPVGNTIFSYVNGKLGNPYDGSNLNCTLNAYKYFCDDLGPDDGLDVLEFGHRGLFQTGFQNERHYTIHFDPTVGLVFNYAVDASWEIPDPDPPVAIPGDFPPAANAPEAYRVEPGIIENTLFFEDASNKGGSATVGVDVYDWWGCDSTQLTVQKLGGWTIATNSPVGGDEHFSTYQFELDGNMLESSDDLEFLISADSLGATYGLGDITDENVASYVFFTVPVGESAMDPEVYTINPDNEYIDETIEDVEVTGINFASNAQVTLVDDATGGIEIAATNEVVTDGNLIVCDLDLTAPGIEPGKYDVIVTNPDTSLFGVLDKGFTVNDLAHPWPSWRGGDLKQGSSQYVGYGDASASSTPKWTFAADTQGHTGIAISNDGTIYFSAWNCALYAVNPDGSQKWKFNPYTPWISFCPAIDLEGYVYTAMGNSTMNYMYKVDPATGSQVWSCYLSNVPCYASAPVIGQDGAIYVAYSTAYNAGKIQRVNPDGTLGWSYSIPSSAYSYTWELGCAILPNGNIIAPGGTHGKILCFEPDGDLVWEYQYTSWILHTPSVGPEGNIYFTTWEGGDITALDSDGDWLWTYDTTFYMWASPAVDPDTGNVFIGDRLGHFRCFSSTGTVLWDHPFASTGIDGSAAVDGNGDVYVAVGHQPSAPFVGLVKMDGDNGNILWQSDNLGYLQTHAPAIGADGTVYLTGHFAETALYAWGD